MTNLNSTLCVQRSIEYALHQLQGNGVLTDLLSKWLPAAACEAAVKDPERRRLRDGKREGSRQHRRLKATGGTSGDAADVEDEFTMQVQDFFGLFVVWCGVTAILLGSHVTFNLWSVIKTWVQVRRGFATGAEPGSGRIAAHKADEAGRVGLAHLRGSQLPGGVSGDNTNEMLRYLVSEIVQLRAAVKVIEAKEAEIEQPAMAVVASNVRLSKDFIEKLAHRQARI